MSIKISVSVLICLYQLCHLEQQGYDQHSTMVFAICGELLESACILSAISFVTEFNKNDSAVCEECVNNAIAIKFDREFT